MYIFTVACAHKQELKYKYTSSKPYLGSLTREEIVVDKIAVSLKDEKLFASGMDSTYVIVQLFDESNELLTDVDPSDLTLSSSEDIEAKPFTLKQGVYKAEILPRVKSPSIQMQVDWQEKVLSKEFTLHTTIAPIKDELVPELDETETQTFGDIDVTRQKRRSRKSVGFSFDNTGDNKIVNATKNEYSFRNFVFEYPELARQNIMLQVDDAPNDKISHTMHSVFMFFPRQQLFTVEQQTGTIQVTLPNGEKMVFNKDSKEVISGVFEEGPVDVSKDPHKRSYADLKYKGQGIVLRANSRGQSPQLGQFEKLQIDQEHGVRGAIDVLIINGQTGQRCVRPKTDFWEPIDVSPIEFKFPKDEDFDQYLKNHCGFGLPGAHPKLANLQRRPSKK